MRAPLRFAVLALLPCASVSAQWSETQAFPAPANIKLGSDADVHGDLAAAGSVAWSQWRGAVQPYERSGGSWSELPRLKASDGQAGDRLGSAVAVEGNTILAGASHVSGPQFPVGAAYVFERDPDTGTWSEQRLDPVSSASGAYFGQAVDLSGDLAVVASNKEVYTFERDPVSPGAWVRRAQVLTSPGTLLWHACRLDGSTLVVTDREDISVYERDPSGDWSLTIARSGTSSYAFGHALDLFCDTLVVSDYATQEVFIRERHAGGPDAWGLVATPLPPSLSNNDDFGFAVGLWGDTLIVGAPLDNGFSMQDVGSIAVFGRDVGGPGAWGFVERQWASDRHAFDRFGTSLALDDDTLIVCSDDNGPDFASAYLFDGPPQVVTYCTSGTTANGCNAVIDSTGHATSASSGFVVSASGVEGAKQGLFYFGTSGAKASPWGGGSSFQCVKGPHVRTPVQSSGGVAGQCDGAFTLDFNAWMHANPSKAPQAGDRAWMQAWFRDPGSSPSTSLSNGLEFDVCP